MEIVKVYQTRFGVDEKRPNVLGNCMAACVASFIQCRCNDVYQFQELRYRLPAKQVEAEWKSWLTERGYKVNQIYEAPLCRPYIAIGPAYRGDHLHAVIYQDDEMIHDPHKDSTHPGIKYVTSMWEVADLPGYQAFISRLLYAKTPQGLQAVWKRGAKGVEVSKNDMRIANHIFKYKINTL